MFLSSLYFSAKSFLVIWLQFDECFEKLILTGDMNVVLLCRRLYICLTEALRCSWGVKQRLSGHTHTHSLILISASCPFCVGLACSSCVWVSISLNVCEWFLFFFLTMLPLWWIAACGGCSSAFCLGHAWINCSLWSRAGVKTVKEFKR